MVLPLIVNSGPIAQAKQLPVCSPLLVAGDGWDEAVAKNLEAGIYNHSFRPIGPESPAFCIWEVRKGITAEDFQDVIDGPNGVNFGLGEWMNICKEINVEMAGNTPYPNKF